MAGVEGAGLCGGGGEVPGDGAAEAPGAGEGVAPGHLDEEPGSPDLGEPPARLVNGGDDAGECVEIKLTSQGRCISADTVGLSLIDVTYVLWR